jgi:hypothetical protein
MDVLLADPVKAAILPPDLARHLLCSLAGLLPVLIARASTATATGLGEPPVEDRWLTVQETTTLFRVSEQWLYRHKKKLPHSQPSRKVLLFPEQKLRRWFTSRKTG